MVIAAPGGLVTLLFTDIEGSTGLLERLRDRYAQVLGDHRALMRASFERWGGYEVDTQGDSFFAVFPTAADALRCAVEVQHGLLAHSWPGGQAVRVRMGLHTGEPMIAEGRYVGIDVHRGARIGAAAHGGQILVSSRTREEASALGDGMSFQSLGIHRFKGISEPTEVFEVMAAGLLAGFPPIKTAVPEEQAPAPGAPPYRGLLRFDEGDAGLFFGRERVTAEIVQALGQEPFLAVVGASGSGKSSIVRAGVIPAVKDAARGQGGAASPESTPARWRVFVLTPTASPVESLIAAVTRGARRAGDRAALAARLRQEPRELTSLLVAKAGRGERVLLAVDQLEEVFSQCRSEPDRAAFLTAVVQAARPGAAPADQPPVTVLVTLRADFYAHLAGYPRLRSAIAEHQVYVGPMDTDELRRAIEEPARLGGWQITPGLVDLLLRDVADQPGGLPLLSHALLETWRRRRGSVLTLKGYFESGEVRGAIAKTADRVYARLSGPDRALAKQIMLRLTELGEEAQDTRRRASLRELVPAGGGEAVDRAGEVLRTLVEARLVTVDKEHAEVAHEALIREWPTLQEWLSQDREGLRIRRQLSDAGHEWQGLAEEPSLLYRGPGSPRRKSGRGPTRRPSTSSNGRFSRRPRRGSATRKPNGRQPGSASWRRPSGLRRPSAAAPRSRPPPPTGSAAGPWCWPAWWWRPSPWGSPPCSFRASRRSERRRPGPRRPAPPCASWPMRPTPT